MLNQLERIFPASGQQAARAPAVWTKFLVECVRFCYVTPHGEAPDGSASRSVSSIDWRTIAKGTAMRLAPTLRPLGGSVACPRRSGNGRWTTLLLVFGAVLSLTGFADTPGAIDTVEPAEQRADALPDNDSPGSPSGAESDEPSPAAESLLRWGLKRASQKRYKEAEIAFLRVTTLDPENVRAWNNLGVARRKQGKLAEASEAYRKAIQIAPTFGLTYKNLALTQEQLGETWGAIVSYGAYLRNRPRAADADQVQARMEWLEQKQ